MVESLRFDELYELAMAQMPLGEKSVWDATPRKYICIPRTFNAKAVRESARIKPDLHNQVRRFSSGMTLADGGHMRLPAKWGSGHG
ncbi:hypothetical protein AD950_04055 [Gluconobacter oxydans]|nr:hypothetical protein AD950_04055 [Gluconobacter oxydans]